MGLKLCPTTVSFIFVLEFHRGLFAGLSDVGVVSRVVRIGDTMREGTGGRRAVDGSDLRGAGLVPTGKLEYRRFGGWEAVLGGWRIFFPANVLVSCSLLLRLMMILEAGELFGVSTAEPDNEASVRVDSTVDTESRSLREALKSSRTASMSVISVSRWDTFCLTSCWMRRISPLTVDLCFISMSISSSTRFIDGG